MPSKFGASIGIQSDTGPNSIPFEAMRYDSIELNWIEEYLAEKKSAKRACRESFLINNLAQMEMVKERDKEREKGERDGSGASTFALI